MSGIYIHIPFCKQKCSYCDFHFSTTYSRYRSDMIALICEEINHRQDYLQDKALKSIYFGGGTPSLLRDDELKKIMTSIRDNFTVSPDAEITLEANPDDISLNALETWKAHGINRLSVGIQSFREKDLTWMNRAHNAAEARQCIQVAQAAGFKNISVDLIYGLPELSSEEWEQHLDAVLGMEVQHISAYCLTVEKKTALNQMVRTRKIVPAGDDEQSEQFLLMSSKLQQAGFHHYEISNFGRPGYEAIHNSSYWKGDHYLGVGPSAHSFNGSSRRWNVASNQRYLREAGKTDLWFEEEHLTDKDRWNELILTGLRTSYGVSVDRLSDITSPSSDFQENINDFVMKGWMTRSNDRLVLTSEGRLMADHIAAELFL